MFESATRLETWVDVLGHLRGSYREHQGLGEDAIEIVVALDRPAAPPGTFWHEAATEAARVGLARQAVRVSVHDEPGARWLRILSVIGSVRYLSRLELLAKNLHSPIGAYCMTGGELAMRQALPLIGLRQDVLDEVIHAVAHQSAWTRHTIEDEQSG